MKKHLTGIFTLVSFILLCLIIVLIWGQGKEVKALYVKTAAVLFCLTLSLAGIYLTDLFAKESRPIFRKLTYALGIVLALISALIIFDVLPYLKTWNYLVAGYILFILSIQLQLLKWGQVVPQLVRFSSLFIILSDVFLFLFYITKWHAYELEAPIKISAFLSLVLTYVGVFMLRQKKTAKSAE